jgi:hypothetical protein
MSPSKNIPSVFDSSDCERPACADMQQMFRQQQQLLNTTKNAKDSVKSPNEAQANKQVSTDKVMLECPADSATLGRASWTLLHSLVIQFLAL